MQPCQPRQPLGHSGAALRSSSGKESSMEHRDIDQIRGLADVQPSPPQQVLTRRERLERWAELLERDPNRRLSTLGEIEFAPRAERPSMRADNSPLAVAFE